ncbi:hypothetical protein CHELA1G11_12727 [Hyphomicrobiales bacterium]|nr:hypothetical protein CHELA1G11_12727 [Hyphomicrobiales bacterium]
MMIGTAFGKRAGKQERHDLVELDRALLVVREGRDLLAGEQDAHHY